MLNFKSFKTEDSHIHFLIQYPIELTKANEEETQIKTLLKTPITCFVSATEFKLSEGRNDKYEQNTDEKIDAIYFISPNPKRIGGSNFLQTTLLEGNSDDGNFAVRSLGLKINQIVFNKVGLARCPVYVYLTSDVKNHIRWEAQTLDVLKDFNSNFKI